MFIKYTILCLLIYVLYSYKGLGPTVPELGDVSHAKKFDKTCFSMVLPEVEEELKSSGRQSVILCGIETQACILVILFRTLIINGTVF